jgi:hypothetical protein
MALISSEYSFIRNAFGALALIALSPLIVITLLIKFALLPFERPPYVVDHLRKFLTDEAGSDRFWDAFISVPLADPVLEDIRREAAAIDLPLDDEGRQKLESLIVRAEAAAGARLSTGVSSRVR